MSVDRLSLNATQRQLVTHILVLDIKRGQEANTLDLSLYC